MRALLIGASGQLGHALAAAFATNYEVITSGYRHARPGDLVVDLGDPSSLASALSETKPDVVLLAGAYTQVDRCESEPAACERINVDGPRAVAQYARARDALVVYYSTDHVFAGGERRFTEVDAIAPANAYAKSKVAGEAAVRALVPERHLILRTSWVYGPDPVRRNFALRLVDRLRNGEMVKVPSDQWGCPTFTEDLAAATVVLVDRGLSGTFHAAGPEIVDRMTLAQRVCACFDVSSDGLVPTPTADLGQPAPRPRRVALDCAKLEAAVRVRFRDVDSGLARLAAADGAI